MPRERARAKASPTPSQEGGAKARARSREAFPIVGIGASAGGLEACRQLLEHLRPDIGMGFVLVQHLDPKHESRMSELLSAATRMPVVEAREGMRVEPDHVYVIPPNRVMSLREGALHLERRKDGGTVQMPVDLFLHSLAAAKKNLAIGVILSGTASDGAAAMRVIKEAGGITFAQDSATDKHHGMPHSSIVTGAVDYVLPPAKIADYLARIGRHPYVKLPQTDEKPRRPPQAEPEGALGQLFQLLRKNFGTDLSRYKSSTIQRRLRRRMAVKLVDNLEDYVEVAAKDPEELRALYQDMFIGVTSFFREPDTFEALKKIVFPRIIKAHSRDAPIRIWVPGCSTGEEVYSLAIALLQYLGDGGGSTEIQIFGTDVNEDAIQKARHGTYPEGIAYDASRGTLRRFFLKVEAGYQVSKTIRDMCVFAVHDILRDPPFSRLDLLSCRNLLIYLDVTLQKRLIPLFHYALKPGGFLTLGSAETIGEFGGLFTLADRKHKIYARKDGAAHPRFEPVEAARPAVVRPHETESPAAPRSAFEVQKQAADLLMLNQYAPAAVLVNERLEIMHFRGRTGDYLEPAPGVASLSLLKMARGGLLAPLRTALETARKKRIAVRKEHLAVESNGKEQIVNLHVTPIRTPGSGRKEQAYLVLFEDVTRSAVAGAPVKGPRKGKGRERSEEQSARVAQMRQELAATKSYLQSMIEDHESGNEELRSLNEEILSANEELQSTTEELETANEELQSANEELTTVNDELNTRNEELTQAHDDILNLLSSMNLSTLILDRGLCVRRFTPTAQKHMNLAASDVGRPITDMRLGLDLPNLDELLVEAMDAVQPKQFEIEGRDGRWYSLQIRPYVTAENRIEGVVLALVDIHELHERSLDLARSNEKLQRELQLREQAEQTFRKLVETIPEAMVVAGRECRITLVNARAEEVLGFSRAELAGKAIETVLAEPYRARMNARCQEMLAGTHPRAAHSGIEMVAQRKDGSTFSAEISLSPTSPSSGPLVCATITDLTFRQQAAEQARESAVTEERNRLAREIHDTLAQGFTAIILQLEVLQTMVSDPVMQQRLEKVSHLARANLEDARRSVLALQPARNTVTELDVNLGRYVGSISDGVSTRVVFAVEGERRPIPSRTAEELLRVAQESVTNALKHAAPTEVKVELVYGEKKLALRVTNDGDGFDVDNPPRRGVGLASFRERCARVGAQLHIKSKPGSEGTVIKVVVPFD